jgi:hypothetical protein
MSMFDKPDQLCECGRMKVGICWSEGTVAAIHGAYEWICKLCAVERQIDHIEAQYERLEGLYEDLETLQKMVNILNEQEETVPRD